MALEGRLVWQYRGRRGRLLFASVASIARYVEASAKLRKWDAPNLATMPFERVAVTGVGVVSALGTGAEVTFRRLMTGERGVSPIRAFDPKDARSRLVAEVEGLDVSSVAPRGERDVWSRTDALAFVAAREALAVARHAGGRLGIAHAGTTGAMLETEGDSFPSQPDSSNRFARSAS